MWWRWNTESVAVDGNNKYDSQGGGGGHLSESPTLSCEPVTQFHIQYSATVKGSSLSGIFLIYDKTIGLYISLLPKYGTVIG